MNTELLISAFSNDPLFSRIFADEDQTKTKRANQWYFKGILEACRRYGGVAVTPDNFGIIAWADGKHFPVHFDESYLQKADDDILHKMEKYDVHERLTEQYISEHGVNYGYVCLLAVYEQARGRGYARQLLNESMQQMKAKGIEYCWLTTENPENLSFYAKNGFMLVHQGITDIGIKVYFFKQKID